MNVSTDRLFALGDIHGCLPALETLLAAIQPGPRTRSSCLAITSIAALRVAR